jgi:ferredoxin
MKVEIDRDGCIGNGNCESVCSEVFRVESGKATVIAKEVGQDRLDEVVHAATDCPVQVITVWEGSKRVYPPKK